MRVVLSVGVMYFFEIFVVVGRVDGLKFGIYYYDFFEYSLILVKEGDFRREF